MNIAIFASHNGSNVQALIDACTSGKLGAAVCAVISNNGDAYALQRAKEAGIMYFHVSAKKCGSAAAAEAEMLRILDDCQTDVIFLAGYLKKIGACILKQYHNRIFNIHPALLPKYGGKGMFGLNVHRAVISAGETVSGVTVHRVNDAYDQGEIVAQTTVALSENETAESLAAKILAREHTFIVEVVDEIVNGDITLGVPLT